MPATTLQKLRDTLGAAVVLRLLDHDNDGVEDANLVTQVLSATDSDLRIVLGRAFTDEEFAKEGEDLQNLAAQIAAYHAYLKRPELRDADGNTPWEKEREAAMTTALDVANGKGRLDRDASGRSYRGNAPGYVPTTAPYFTGPGGTGDF